MITLGFDLSISSTGVCVNRDGQCSYIIVSSETKKMYKEFKNNSVLSIQLYDKQKKADDYAENEVIKTNNLYKITEKLKVIALDEKPDLVMIEGISYGSSHSAALADLSGLQFMVRQMLILNNIPFKVIAPAQNKKAATGNGAAKKDLMVSSWLNCIPKDHREYIQSLPKGIKVDDIADAYFLSKCYL